MLWLWILGAIALLVVLIFTIGSMLPEEYRAQGSAVLSIRPADVWKGMLDFETHPMAAKMARNVESLPQENGLPVWIEDIGSSKIRVSTTAREEERLLVREMADRIVPMTARVEFRIEPHEAGAKVRVDNRIRVRRGTWHVPIFRVMLSLFGGAKSGMEAYLRQFAGRDAVFSWQRTR